MKAVAAAAVALILGLSACGTGVDDEKGWNKVLKRGYPCAELIDVAEGLPSSIDRVKVADDLRRAGCEPLHPLPAKAERRLPSELDSRAQRARLLRARHPQPPSAVHVGLILTSESVLVRMYSGRRYALETAPLRCRGRRAPSSWQSRPARPEGDAMGHNRRSVAHRPARRGAPSGPPFESLECGVDCGVEPVGRRLRDRRLSAKAELTTNRDGGDPTPRRGAATGGAGRPRPPPRRSAPSDARAHPGGDRAPVPTPLAVVGVERLREGDEPRRTIVHLSTSDDVGDRAASAQQIQAYWTTRWTRGRLRRRPGPGGPAPTGGRRRQRRLLRRLPSTRRRPAPRSSAGAGPSRPLDPQLQPDRVAHPACVPVDRPASLDHEVPEGAQGVEAPEHVGERAGAHP
jgi:hypothetical protein